MDKQTLITVSIGKYVWEPFLQLIDWIPKGHRRATLTIVLSSADNTELRAMIKATNHMLLMLKEAKKTKNEASS